MASLEETTEEQMKRNYLRGFIGGLRDLGEGVLYIYAEEAWAQRTWASCAGRVDARPYHFTSV